MEAVIEILSLYKEFKPFIKELNPIIFHNSIVLVILLTLAYSFYKKRNFFLTAISKKVKISMYFKSNDVTIRLYLKKEGIDIEQSKDEYDAPFKGAIKTEFSRSVLEKNQNKFIEQSTIWFFIIIIILLVLFITSLVLKLEYYKVTYLLPLLFFITVFHRQNRTIKNTLEDLKNTEKKYEFALRNKKKDDKKAISE